MSSCLKLLIAAKSLDFLLFSLTTFSVYCKLTHIRPSTCLGVFSSCKGCTESYVLVKSMNKWSFLQLRHDLFSLFLKPRVLSTFPNVLLFPVLSACTLFSYSVLLRSLLALCPYVCFCSRYIFVNFFFFLLSVRV